MKPNFIKLPNQGRSLIAARRDKLDHLYKHWHFHEEFELVYIVKSHGVRFIGDHVDTFKAGDLVLLGSLLPHLWLNDNRYFEDDSPGAESIVIHVNKSILNDNGLDFAEFLTIKALFNKANCGIHFRSFDKSIPLLIEEVLNSSGIERIIQFLYLFKELSLLENVETLSTPAFSSMHRKYSSYRLSATYDFIANNFTRKISLDELADLAHMSPQGFCNYFKKKTRKTVFQYINELRIGYAKKLMIEDDLSISEAAFKSGFNSISFFNRLFKKATSLSPSEYKDNFQVIKN